MKSILTVLVILTVALFEATAQYLIIESGSKVILEPGATLVTRNLNVTNNGALELNSTSNFEFTGTVLSSLSGSNGVTFGNIKIDNPGNIEINKTISIGGILDFRYGVLYPLGDELVIFDAGSSYVNARDESYVDGMVRKLGNTSFVFPVGKSGVFRKVGVYSLSGTDSYTCEYFDVPFGEAGVSGPDIDHVSSVEYWTIDREGTTTSTVLLSWDANSGVEVGSTEELVVARYDGTNWLSAGGNAHTGTLTEGTLESDPGLTGFGSFTLGSIEGNPLPVTMLLFNALCDDGLVEVNWETASEKSSDYFVLGKSRDGLNYVELDEIAAAGYSQSVLRYRSVDKEPFINTYYRLKQVDFDGASTYYYTSASGCNDSDSDFLSFISYNTLTVIFYSGKNHHFVLTVYNVMGQLVWKQEGLTEEGTNTFEINSPEFQDNIFLVHLNHDNKRITQKIKSSY